MKNLTLIFSLLFINFTFAQYDYTPAKVFLKDGTILSGEANLFMTNGKTLFKEGEKPIKFKSGELKKQIALKSVDSVVFNVTIETKRNRKKISYTESQKFIPIYLEEKKEHLRMVRLLSKNGLILYSRNIKGGPGYGPISQLFIAKNQDEIPVALVPNSPKRFRKEASNFFKDCASLVEKIESKEYEREHVLEIVNFYNSKCVN